MNGERASLNGDPPSLSGGRCELERSRFELERSGFELERSASSNGEIVHFAWDVCKKKRAGTVELLKNMDSDIKSLQNPQEMLAFGMILFVAHRTHEALETSGARGYPYRIR